MLAATFWERLQEAPRGLPDSVKNVAWGILWIAGACWFYSDSGTIQVIRIT